MILSMAGIFPAIDHYYRAGKGFLSVAVLKSQVEIKLLDLGQAKNIAVIGGGLTGWFAALMLRRVFSPKVEIVVFENPKRPHYSGGEGGLGNFVPNLQRASIDIDEFVKKTDATFKIGNAYHGWRDGGQNDIYYQLFPSPNDHVEEIDFSYRGVWPYLATRIATKTPLHTLFPGFLLIAAGSSQVEANAVFKLRRSGIQPTFHFSAGKLVTLLKNAGMSRQISSRNGRIVDLVSATNGDVTALKLDSGEEVAVDFVIDASGFERISAGKKYKSEWRSFSRSLLENSMLSFSLPNGRKNPSFVSEATALGAGYLWQVPLAGHVSAQYVFSGQYTDATRAKDELQSYLDFTITPTGITTFEPGNFKKIWTNNVVALGDASGFVSPLETPSLGLMLQQLGELERTFLSCHGIIGEQTIEAFNRANDKSFSEVADFLRMHYDGGRRDYAFWRDAGLAERSTSLEAMEACFHKRLPRIIDIDGYNTGWSPLYHLMNWIFVAAPLAIVSVEGALSELNNMPPQIRQRMEQYGQELMQMRGTPVTQPQPREVQKREWVNGQNFLSRGVSYGTPRSNVQVSAKPDSFQEEEGNLRATHR